MFYHQAKLAGFPREHDLDLAQFLAHLMDLLDQ
jgi:hypothetical protein